MQWVNPHYNSLTVDGVRLNDGFGLNSNGYPTQRMLFPYDAISSVAVEILDSVVYGGFSACNINAVTKTGGNEMFGSAFFDKGRMTYAAISSRVTALLSRTTAKHALVLNWAAP